MNNSTLSGAAASTETPEQPYHHDDILILSPNASDFDVLDTLSRYQGHAKSVCDAVSSADDGSIAGVFWMLSDMLDRCEQLTSRLYKSESPAQPPTTTPDQTAPVAAPTTEPPVQNSPLADAVVMPRADHDKLGLALETLRAQLLIAGDPEVYQTHTDRTLGGFVYGMQCEVERAIDLVSGCKTMRNPG